MFWAGLGQERRTEGSDESTSTKSVAGSLKDLMPGVKAVSGTMGRVWKMGTVLL